MLTKHTAGNILLTFNLAKYGKLLPEQNTFDCLSTLLLLFLWCHDDTFSKTSLAACSCFLNIDLQFLRNIDIYMSLTYTHQKQVVCPYLPVKISNQHQNNY